MPVKVIHHPKHGRHVKLGRNRPKHDPGRKYLHFGQYLKAGVTLPTPPATEDWTGKGQPALSNVYGNDTLGDCVIAGGYHNLATWTGNAGALFTATNQQIINDYGSIGGYVPGDPGTDQGCDEVTALDFWTATGFASGDRLAGWLKVDATNQELLKQALYLFENLFFGVELPDAWVNNEPQASGFTWDVAGQPDPSNGHCVVGVGYTAAGVTFDTWGLIGTLTWAALAKYMVESAGGDAYVMVSQAQLVKAQAKAPNGFAWADLIEDFDSIGGDLPVPVGPSPGPVPNPGPPPTPAPAPVDPAACFDAIVIPPDLVDTLSFAGNEFGGNAPSAPGTPGDATVQGGCLAAAVVIRALAACQAASAGKK